MKLIIYYMNIIRLDSINSTNTYCNFLLTNPAGLPEHIRPIEPVELPCAVIAREQYAGRGSYGKNFHSPAGGLYMSYAFESSLDVDDLLKITVVAASLVHEVLQSYSKEELSIKWINDIYLGNRKVAGILTERIDDIRSPGRYYIIIGIGVNVLPASAPEELSDIIGFIGNDKTDSSVIENIASDLTDSFNDIFADCNPDEFPALINYYRLKCRNLPFDFGDKLLNK